MSLDKAERRKTFALFFCGRQRAGGKAPPASLHSATSPLREEAFSRAKPAHRGSSLCGELAEPARPEGLCRAAAVCSVTHGICHKTMPVRRAVCCPATEKAKKQKVRKN